LTEPITAENLAVAHDASTKRPSAALRKKSDHTISQLRQEVHELSETPSRLKPSTTRRRP